MAVIGDTELLELWEHSLGLDPAARAVALAAAVDPARTPGELAGMPVGARDARLLELRAGLSGPQLAATARCPQCDEEVEFEVDAGALAGVGPAGDDVGQAERTLTVEGTRITWRCPTSADLAAIALLGDADAAEAELLSRCVLAVERDGPSGPGPAEAGRRDPAAVLDAAARSALCGAMDDADPLAELLVALDCPGCGEGFAAELDVAEAAWSELDAAATRLLWDVDALARAYGWTEADVLALPPRRRRAYMEMAVGADG